MKVPRSAWLSVVLVAVSTVVAGCEEPSEPAGPPDAAPPVPFACEPSEDMAGEPLTFSLSATVDGRDFVELADGDDCPLVLGFQGLFMLLMELRSPLGVTAEEVCLDCAVSVSPTGSFPGVSQRNFIRFDATSDTMFTAGATIILGIGPDQSQGLNGAEVEVAFQSSGHGLSGEVRRNVRLVVDDGEE